MRTTTSPELAVLAKPERSVTNRVKIANGSGTMIDVSNYVETVTLNYDIDRPVAALTVELRRDSGALLSLSPLRTDSKLNVLDDGVTYAPLLNIGRVLTWEPSTKAIGAYPSGSDYKLLIRGYVDTADFDHSPAVVTVRDLGAIIVDRWIEAVASYGSTGGVALETVMQAELDAVFGSGFIPLNVIGSPSYSVSPAFIQQRQSEMDAQLALAQLPGWDAREWYDSGSGGFKFTLQNPPRSKTTPDYTFGPNAYYDITRLTLDITNIKNVVAVSYFDTASNARLTVTVSDSTSITKYGRRYFFIQEADGSPINTSTEATTMANAALSDLKEPKAEADIELPFFWPCELWDLYRFLPNGVHINTNQDWAVVSFSHKVSRNKHRTTITVRGTPAGGYLTWLDRPGITGGRPGEVGPEAQIAVFGPPSGNTWQVIYTGTGGTTPLTYQRRIDVDNVSTGTYSAPAALGAGVTEWITVQPYYATRVFLRVIDATGLEGNADPFFLAGENASTDKTTGKAKTAQAIAQITATSATQVTVTVTATPASPAQQVQYVAIAGAATLSGGTAAGTWVTPNGTNNVWVFNRAAINAGVGQAQFRAGNTSSYSNADDFIAIEEQGRDTVGLSCRVLRVSETATQIVARLEVISPNVGVTVTVAYNNGGLTVTPASGGTLTSTTSFGTTAHIDYTITKDVAGGTQRRVAFTASATGFVDATDGVDVPAISTDFSGLSLIASANISLNGTSAVPTGGSAWNEQVYSKDGYTGGAYASAVIPAGCSYVMFGLNTDPLTDASDASIDYAIYAEAGGVISGYESGVQVVPNTMGTWAAGDVLAVTYDGSNIRYMQNGTVLRTVPVARALTFFFDSSFNNTASKLNNIRFGPMSSNDAGSVGGLGPMATQGSITLSIGTCKASNAGALGPPWNQLDVSWSTTGMPSGVTYDVGYDNGVVGGSGSASGATSTKTFTSVTFAASPGRGTVTITAYNSAGQVLVTKSASQIYTT